jgi:hypothetical protein
MTLRSVGTKIDVDVANAALVECEEEADVQDSVLQKIRQNFVRSHNLGEERHLVFK